MPGSKQELIPQAVNVSVQPICRWKKADRKGGVDWERARDHRRRKDPRAILAILEAMSKFHLTGECSSRIMLYSRIIYRVAPSARQAARFNGRSSVPVREYSHGSASHHSRGH